MFKNFFTKIYLMAVVFIVVCAFTTPVNAVELTDGVHTGMSFEQVSEQIDLKPHAEDKGLDLYKRKGSSAYYVFSDGYGLMYKIILQPVERWDDMMNTFTEKFGPPTKRPSNNDVMTYFWEIGGGAGLKMSNDPGIEEAFQLWYGSVSLWDQLASESRFFDPFAR